MLDAGVTLTSESKSCAQDQISKEHEMADVSTPDWLAKRGGTLRRSTAGNTWVVLLNSEPQYELRPVPAGGRLACQIVQTVNGRRLDGPETFPSLDEAVRGGLEHLRHALGW